VAVGPEARVHSGHSSLHGLTGSKAAARLVTRPVLLGDEVRRSCRHVSLTTNGPLQGQLSLFSRVPGWRELLTADVQV